jgi:hypothetical protein
MYCPLQRFQNALGKPGKGIHSWRIGGLAGADILMTVAAAGVLSLGTKKSFLLILLLLFVTGIALHRVFCVNTALSLFLFGPLPGPLPDGGVAP